MFARVLVCVEGSRELGIYKSEIRLRVLVCKSYYTDNYRLVDNSR